MIDTTQVQRRKVSYANLDEVIADAQRAASENAAVVGNWTLGQIFEHLAVVMDKTIDGFDMKPPLMVRLVGRFYLKGRFLKQGMTSGFQLKGPAADELVPPEVDTQVALDHLYQAAERVKVEAPHPTHPFFGSLTHDQAKRINCRHAELHMSFVKEA